VCLPYHCGKAHYQTDLSRDRLLRALVHRQFPVGSNVAKAQNIDAVVAGLDLEIPIVRAMPLIDVLDHVDFPIIETESPKFFDAIFIDIGVSVNLHGVPSVSSRWPVDHTGYITFSSLRQSGFAESFMRSSACRLGPLRACVYQFKRQLMQKMKASINVSFEAIAPYDTIAEWL
jgi:hypothetical protein